VLADTQPEEMEYITPHFKRYWLNNKQIVVYVPMSGEEEGLLDKWTDSILSTLRNWSDDKPYREIQDLRQASSNPGNQRKAMTLVRQMAVYEGRSAAIISDSYSGRAFSYFVNHVFKAFTGKIERKVFFSIEEAVEWLSEEGT
jgi:hypothetical protein